jgi:hypothetical protein
MPGPARWPPEGRARWAGPGTAVTGRHSARPALPAPGRRAGARYPPFWQAQPVIRLSQRLAYRAMLWPSRVWAFSRYGRTPTIQSL